MHVVRGGSCAGPSVGTKANAAVKPSKRLYVLKSVACKYSEEGRGGALQQQDTSTSSYNLQISNTNARGLQSVRRLASAWSEVARKLRPQGCIESDSHSEALIIGALKLALAYLQGAPIRSDGREPMARAAMLAAMLADLSSAGIPLDAEAIAAGVVVEAVVAGGLSIRTINERLGSGVASLVHDVLRIRSAPQRVEHYDDTSSSALREWCIAFHDVRANAVEVASRLDELEHMQGLLSSDQQILALEALQLFAPLGHALGLGAISARMEDLCFQVLFPSSYSHTSGWLHRVVDMAEDSLFACQQQLLSALDDHPLFKQLADSCVVRARTKSLYSIMKKILRLEDLSKGGRSRDQVYDVLGMRAVVQPRSDLPQEEAEELASRACYVVCEVAEKLWPQVPGRGKDYIAHPKANGYKSIHLTMQPQPPQPHHLDSDSDVGRHGKHNVEDSDSFTAWPCIELQVRTQLMDEQAEAGDAAHSSYKGGLDSRQARQLREWTERLRMRLAVTQHQGLLLPAPATSTEAVGSNNTLLPQLRGHEEMVARSLFSNMDLDGNGVISIQELREQLRELGDSVSDDDAQAVMAQLAHGGARTRTGLSSNFYQDANIESNLDAKTSLSLGEDEEEGLTLADLSEFVKRVSLVSTSSMEKS